MKNGVKIGIIGCGHWGPNFVRNFSQMPHVKVSSVCDINPQRLHHIKQLYPAIKTFTNYRYILNDSDIDAVVIATPAVTHYTLTKELLLNNKHILVEKPIAMNIAEAEELIRLSIKKRRILMVGHTFMYNPAVKKIKEYIEKGEVGRVFYLHSRRTNLGPLRRDVSAMWDLAPHDISIFSYLLNANPIEVIARGQYYLQRDKEDVAFINLIYPKNIIANIHVSWLDPRKVREITVVGSKKMVIFDDLNLNEPVRLYDKRVMKKKYKQDYDSFEEFQMLIQEGEVIIPVVKIEEPLKIECRDFLECINENKNPLSDGGSGLNILKVLIAIQESLEKKGEAVSII